jgi:hypothetical protein
MPERTLSACPLPGGGVRYLASPWIGFVPLLFFSGAAVWLFGPAFAIDLLFNPIHASSPKEGLVLLPLLMLAWLLALSAVLFLRRGILLAEGRLGVAWWFGRRLIRCHYRDLADVRRLVVLRHTDRLVAGCEQARPLVLARRYPRPMLLSIAHELAARCQALTGVAVRVHEEELAFTRDRAEQPIFSRVKVTTDGPATTFTFPSVWWRVSRVDSRPWLFWLDGGRYLARCVVGGVVMLVGLLLLAAANWSAVNHILGTPSRLIVRAGTVRLPAPPPNPSVAVRLREAAWDLGGTVGCLGPLLALGLWLIHSARKEAARCRGEMVARRRTVLRRRRPLVLTITPEELSLGVPSRAEPEARWPHVEVASVEAFYNVEERSSEGGGTTVTITTGVHILTLGDEEWTLQQGTSHADWSWVATRVRALLGLDAASPALSREQVTTALPGQIHSAAESRSEERFLRSPSEVTPTSPRSSVAG